MVEALVSKVLEQLVSITLQQMEEGIKLVEVEGIDEEMGRLTNNFKAIKAVLIDAEKRQVKEKDVRDWLDKLKNIAYDVDDVLDEWNTTIQKLQIAKVEDAFKPSRTVCSLIPYYMCCRRLFILHHDIAGKIRNLDSRLDIVTMEKDRFQFSSIAKESKEPERQMTNSIIVINHNITQERLSEEECWSMFSEIAFFERTHEECENFKEIGRKIVHKCKGVPLAINILASLLSFKTNIEGWQDVLDSEIWEMEEVRQRLFRPLLLGYYNLPSTVKMCFLYCAIFPKKYKIEKDELIKLWMAQDYLKAENNKDIELVGEDYFKILTMRSFFQNFDKDPLDDIISFYMHETVHDFAQFLSHDEFFIEGKSENDFSSKKFRHARINAIGGGSFSALFSSSVCSVRSLVVASDFRSVKMTSLTKLFDHLTCLRTLDLGNQDFRRIPININKLVHLRYLNLSKNRILKALPGTLCELYNLQILNISGCENVKKLPQGIGNLLNLRCLENRKARLRCMPKSFEKLTGLRRLDKFVISDGGYSSKGACSVECLKNFKSLQKINIKGLGRLQGVDKAKGVELYNKKNLRVLNLGFHGRVDSDDVRIIEALQPHTNLEKLKIKRHNGCTVFPDWMMSLTNLRELSIKRCRFSENLYGLGKLSSLESLQIWYNQKIKKVGNDFLGMESDARSSSSSSSIVIFPKLKFLWFGFMYDWEEWNYEIKKRGGKEIKVMPCLRTLKIESCYKLKSLPNHLRQMTTLKMEIVRSPLLKEEIERSERPSSSAAVNS